MINMEVKDAVPTNSSKTTPRPSLISCPSCTNFQEILIEINRELTQPEKEEWIFLRSDDVPKAHQEEFKTKGKFLAFFDYMHKLDIFTLKNISNLCTDLKKLKHNQLHNTVKKMLECSCKGSAEPITEGMRELNLEESFKYGCTPTAEQPHTKPRGDGIPIRRNLQTTEKSQPQKLHFMSPESQVRSQAQEQQTGASGSIGQGSSTMCMQETLSAGTQIVSSSVLTSSSASATIKESEGQEKLAASSPFPHQEDISPKQRECLRHPNKTPPPSFEPQSVLSRFNSLSSKVGDQNLQGLPYLNVSPESAKSSGAPFAHAEIHSTSVQSAPCNLGSVSESVDSFAEDSHQHHGSTSPGCSVPKQGRIDPQNSSDRSGELQQEDTVQNFSLGTCSSSVIQSTYSSHSESYTHSEVSESGVLMQESSHMQASSEMIQSDGALHNLTLHEFEQIIKEPSVIMSLDSVKDSVSDAQCVPQNIETLLQGFIKEKQDEEEKEKCEVGDECEDMDIEETGIDDVTTNMEISSMSEVPVRSAMYEEDITTSSESSAFATLEEEGIWPALEVAKQLSEEKRKKEEAEAATEYDDTTGIEKKLYEKMKSRPQELTPQERESINQQMMQHLQKKASPPKTEEDEIKFDPEGKLSPYQRELAEPGLLGFNYIICAPVRTGKVLTAAGVCNHQRKDAVAKGKPFKALFITHDSAVKERHTRAFRDIFPPGSVTVLDKASKFKEVFGLPSVSVLMVPAERLASALRAEELAFADVNIVVLDECHLAATVHPAYNEITKYYLAEKKKTLATKAPRGAWTLGRPYGGICCVIGLTPHLGAGLGTFTRESIVRQCGILDSKGVRRVETVENLTALLDANKPPEMDTIVLATPSPSTTNGSFRSVLEKIMSTVEERFGLKPAVPGVAGDTISRQQQAAPAHGSEDYLRWLQPQLAEARLCEDGERCAPLMVLAGLNEALVIGEDLRPSEALAFLKKFREDLKREASFTSTAGKACEKILREQEPDLTRLAWAEGPTRLTPKLACLTQKLSQVFEEDRSTVGLVLVRYASIAAGMVKILQSHVPTTSLSIKAVHLTGPAEDGDEGSGVVAEQKKILDGIRQGTANLIVSTDFEQASLDLPRCDVVIRYNLVSDDMGIVQWTGRNKAKTNSCFLLLERESAGRQRELHRRAGLRELEGHLKILNNMDSRKWYDLVEEKQLAVIRENAQKDFVLNYRRFTRQARDYTLECGKCGAFVCNAHYLLRRGPHVSCSDASCKERLRIDSLSQVIYGSDDDTTGVLKCRGTDCCNRLGLAVDFKRRGDTEEGYGFDVRALYFTYLEGQHTEYVGRRFPSWDEVDFFIREEDWEGSRRRTGRGGDRGDDDDDDGDDNRRGGGGGSGRRRGDGTGDDEKKMEEGGGPGTATSKGGQTGRGGAREGRPKRGEEEQMDEGSETDTKRRKSHQDKDDSSDGNVDR